MKIRIICLIVFLFLIIPIYGQADSTKLNSEELIAMKWIADLYDSGVANINDSLYTSVEFRKALLDTNYRKVIYPKVYNWNDVLGFMKTNGLKRAFWHLINLYYKSEENKENVLRIMLSYIEVLEMDKVLIGTFYTYCYQDPEIGIIVDEKPEVKRPDILEAKLRSVREIVSYICAYQNKTQEIEKK